MSRNREHIFRFKEFAVINERSAMKVGTDGVLLGAWADARNASTILDIGTGCGLIALMIAQRTPEATITAIEIDKDAADEAAINFSNSPWSKRLECINADFKEFVLSDNRSFDLIVSNPPFFENALHCPDSSRTSARHDTSLNYKDIITAAPRILSPNGALCIILPSDTDDAVNAIVAKAGGYIQKRCHVYPTTDSTAPKRTLFKIKFNSTESLTTTESLTIELSRHNYTADYINLTKEFYLNF